MKCLILGGGGFQGSHLADALLARGDPVRILERPGFPKGNIAHLAGRLHLLEADLEEPGVLDRALEGIEVVFHLAATTVPASSNRDPISDLTTNVLPTLRLLAALKTRPGCRLVFFSSGGTVYGMPQWLPISEDHPTNPISAYGIHKLTIEKYLEMHEHLYGLEFRILRISNAYGERQSPTSGQGAVAAFLYRAYRNEAIEVWGDGSVVRDYIHVSDVVRATVHCAEYDGDARLFNIGSGLGRSLTDVLEAIEHTVGHKLDVRYGATRSLDVQANVLDPTRARAHLGWSPEVPFDDGLARTLRYVAGLTG